MKRKNIGFIILVLALIGGIFYLFVYDSIDYKLKRKKLRNLNIILITIDTLRASHVSIYGRGKANTPNLDELAKEGAYFKKCITQTPLTLPSHTTILSGTYPLYHKVRDNGGFIVPEKLTLISEILKKNGFSTAAFIAAYVLHSKWGLNQGFDYYEDSFDMTKYKSVSLSKIQKRADEVLKEAEAWISKKKNNKFFAWIHLYDPHTPYDPPPPYKEKFFDQPYRGEVEYTDYQLGLFFDYLKREGLYNKSLIIVVADHGESLGQHGEKTHGFFLYDPTVWVPFIIRAPFKFKKHRIDQVVELVDVTPTILDALGIKKDREIQGKSVLGLLFGKSSSFPELAYTETFYPRFHYGWSELKAIYYKNYKYILAPKDELYDLSKDERERKNISLYKTRIRKKLRKMIEKFIKEKSKNSLNVLENKSLNREEMRKLAALGYISTFVDTSQKNNLPDPKDKIKIYNSLLKSKRLMKEKKYKEAIDTVKNILKTDPEIVDAYMLLGNLYYREREFEKAMESFYEVLKRKPDYNFATINIINCLVGLEKFDEAEKTAADFIKRFPTDYALYMELGKIKLIKGDYDNALKMYQKALSLDPKNSEAMNKVAEILIVKKEFNKARKFLLKASKISPEGKEIYYNLAQIAEKEGNIEKAIEYYKKEIKNNPENFKAYYNLAENLREIGENNEAVKYYSKTIEVNPDFNIPYFMIAKYLLDTRNDLQRAITLCKKGIEIKPYNKYTVFGYYILSDIYSLLGDKINSEKYYKEGKNLLSKLKTK